jgi:hypothetical protein
MKSSRLRPSSTPRSFLLLLLLHLVALFLLSDDVDTRNGSTIISIFALAQEASSENNNSESKECTAGLGQDAVSDEEYHENDCNDQITHKITATSADLAGGDGCTDGMPCTTKDIFHHYNCESTLLSPDPLPIHEKSTWIKLREAYITTVGVENATIHVPIKEESGFHVPYYVTHSPANGRGVYAKYPISKGQKVWQGWNATSAYFKTGDEFRNFLNLVGNGVVCDLLIWCYPTFLDINKTIESLRIACDLDEGSLINEVDGNTVQNLEIYVNGTDEHLYANRDIEEGEELLMRYADFTGEGLWEKFGLESVWIEDGEVGFEG